jgi:hypothetical protein
LTKSPGITSREVPVDAETSFKTVLEKPLGQMTEVADTTLGEGRFNAEMLSKGIPGKSL